MSQISEKQLRARIQQAQDEHQHAARSEAEKRMFVERDNGIDFWRETAMSWHSKAKRLADQLALSQHDARSLGNEVKLTSIERDHWRAEYDQNYQDVLRAEARCDAISDIMDALARGWRMEPFDGCAKWWRHDTDTLQAIAKAAREWEAGQDSKPLPDHACVPCFTDAGPCTDPAQCHVGAQQVDPTSGEVEAEELIGIANHMAGSLGSMPDEWQAWAIEIEQDIRRAATRVRKIEDQPCDCQAYPILGHETPAETQSGYNRLKHATGLIMQLPTDHDGRNTWLMNYAERNSLEEQKLIRANPALFDEPAQAFAVLQHKRGNWIVWEWDYQPGDMPATAIVEIKTHDNRTNILEASVIDWSQVAKYRIIQRDPGVDAEHAAKAD